VHAVLAGQEPWPTEQTRSAQTVCAEERITQAGRPLTPSPSASTGHHPPQQARPPASRPSGSRWSTISRRQPNPVSSRRFHPMAQTCLDGLVATRRLQAHPGQAEHVRSRNMVVPKTCTRVRITRVRASRVGAPPSNIHGSSFGISPSRWCRPGSTDQRPSSPAPCGLASRGAVAAADRRQLGHFLELLDPVAKRALLELQRSASSIPSPASPELVGPAPPRFAWIPRGSAAR